MRLCHGTWDPAWIPQVYNTRQCGRSIPLWKSTQETSYRRVGLAWWVHGHKERKTHHEPISACCCKISKDNLASPPSLVVERGGTTMLRDLDDDSFHNDKKISKLSIFFQILHNQTPNIQESNSLFKFAMKSSHAKNTDKYSCFINFTIQDHPSIHNHFTYDKHWVLDLVSHSYYLKAWVWWYLQ